MIIRTSTEFILSRISNLLDYSDTYQNNFQKKKPKSPELFFRILVHLGLHLDTLDYK